MVIDIDPANSSFPITLYVDVNGEKGPNKIGYDLWNMSIFYDGSIDESGVNPECKQGKKAKDGLKYLCGGRGTTPSEARETQFINCINEERAGGNNYGGCFGHFLENGFKFDY